VKHVANISRTPSIAQGGIDQGESFILLLFTLAFSGWDNFPSVIQNLQKAFQKS
jgi:hypothetical protein